MNLNVYINYIIYNEELLDRISENNIKTEDMVSVIFTVMPDLDKVFPAVAARRLGWTEVPLFGTQEIDQPDGVKLCIRVLILLNTELKQKEMRHVYLHGAKVLRQDIKR